jgi:2-iminobutanoate/2-iminopropanoate deaminase
MRRVLPLVLLVATACATASKPAVEFLARPGSIGPFSEAVRAGNIVFLSGMLGTDSTGRLAAGGVGPETRQTLTNIRAALARNGLTMNDVVKCTVFLADIAEWGAMNQVYATFFPESKPARSAVGGTGLVRNARVEIECIAAIK